MQVYKNCPKNEFFQQPKYQVIIQIPNLVKVLWKSG